MDLLSRREALRWVAYSAAAAVFFQQIPEAAAQAAAQPKSPDGDANKEVENTDGKKRKVGSTCGETSDKDVCGTANAPCAANPPVASAE